MAETQTQTAFLQRGESRLFVFEVLLRCPFCAVYLCPSHLPSGYSPCPTHLETLGLIFFHLPRMSCADSWLRFSRYLYPFDATSAYEILAVHWDSDIGAAGEVVLGLWGEIVSSGNLYFLGVSDRVSSTRHRTQTNHESVKSSILCRGSALRVFSSINGTCTQCVLGTCSSLTAVVSLGIPRSTTAGS